MQSYLYLSLAKALTHSCEPSPNARPVNNLYQSTCQSVSSCVRQKKAKSDDLIGSN